MSIQCPRCGSVLKPRANVYSSDVYCYCEICKIRYELNEITDSDNSNDNSDRRSSNAPELSHRKEGRKESRKNRRLSNAPGLSTPIASHLERNTQLQHYHNEKAGHGFAAEDANALNDVLHGRNVEKTGLGNALNGPDRIVDGQGIQVKYYSTARESIDAAFSRQNGGCYRYPGQKLEVPADQYDEAVNRMREKISQGLVRDSKGKVIKNPDKATDIVQKGSVTYEQAKNIAKAGNIDSLIFDIKNQAITCACVFGASFAISFAMRIWKGDSVEEALKNSINQALQSGLAAGMIGVVSSQVLRFKSAAAGTVVARQGVSLIAKTELGKQAVTAIAKASLGKAVYGAAAVNHVSKLVRSNVVTSAIALGISTAPDMYRAIISQNISWAQFSKNLAVNTASVAGGAGGWWGGAAVGAAVGSVIPGIGNVVGGFIGGVAGALGVGYAAGKVAKGVLDEFVEDDAKKMIALLQIEAEESAQAHLLSEDEVRSKLVPEITKTVTAKWLRSMYGSSRSDSGRARFAREMLDKICMDILKSRKRIIIPDTTTLIERFSIAIYNSSVIARFLFWFDKFINFFKRKLKL